MKYYLKKNKLSIVISIILIIAAYFLCAFINNSGMSSSDLEVKEYKVNLQINKDGSGSFDNYITYDFSNADYKTIYEDIGYTKTDIFTYGDINNNKVIEKSNKYSDKATFDTSSFKTRVFQDNQEIKVDKIGYSFKNDNINNYAENSVDRVKPGQERVFCYNSKGYNKDTTFNYQYKIDGIVSKYLDIGIINWILSPSVDMVMENLSFKITFEEELNTDYLKILKENFNIYGNVSYNNLVINEQGISFNVEKQKGNQSVEVRMGFSQELVSQTSEINSYDYDALDLLKKVDKLAKDSFEEYNNRYYNIQTWLLIIVPILIGITAIIWTHAYKKYDKERISSFDAEYYRELPADYPPAELGYLYNFKETSKDDLSATIMDLIRKGFIELDTNGQSTLDDKPNYLYKFNKNKNQSSLRSYEKFVLEWYFNHITQEETLSFEEIDTYLKNEKQAQRYLKDNETFIKLVRQEARKNKFFDEFRNLSIKYSFFYIILIAFFIITIFFQILNYYTYALVFSSISIGILILLASYISSIKRRSEKGNEEYVRWRAFRNFLLEFGKFEDYTMPLIEIWEHYMVYAVSFGIAEEVEKQMRLHFKSLGEDKFEVYYNSSPMFYSRSYIFISRRSHSSTMAARATIAQAQAARASRNGGSGFGGGFGGGRSFGGGGGGRGGC